MPKHEVYDEHSFFKINNSADKIITDSHKKQDQIHICVPNQVNKSLRKSLKDHNKFKCTWNKKSSNQTVLN